MTSRNPATLATVNHLRDIAHRAAVNLASLADSRRDDWLFSSEYGGLNATVTRLWRQALDASTAALASGEVDRADLVKL